MTTSLLPVATTDFAPLALADLPAELPAGVARYVEAGLAGADNTVRAYQKDIKSFVAYCQQADFAPFPAAVATLAGYVAYLADRPEKPCKLVTIRRHLAAIQKQHVLRGLPSKVGAPALEIMLDGVGRVLGTRQTQAPAFTVARLKRAIAGLVLATEEGLPNAEGLRDRALLLLGYSGAFRRSELVALNIEQLELTDDALLVHLAKSKTNQTGNPEDKAVFYAADRRYCPVRACQEWVRQLGRETGPLFVSMSRGKRGQAGRPGPRRLSAVYVNALVKKQLGAEFSAHSLRASFITNARANGETNERIKNQTKQKTDATVDRYSRLHDVVHDNAAKNIGL